MNICDHIRRRSQWHPHRPALIDGDRIVGYGALDRCVGQTAAHLVALGVRPGDRVACGLQDNADHVITMLAIMSAGGVYVPLDWRATDAERTRLATWLGVTCALLAPGLEPLTVPSHAVDAEWHRAVANAPVLAPVSGADLPCLIGLSSGTTGEPTGVAMSHEQLTLQSVSRWHSVPRPGVVRYLSALPLYFSAGRQALLDNLLFGATVVLYPALFGAEEFVDQIRRNEVNSTMVVPTVLRWLLDLPATAPCVLPELDLLLCGAAVLHAEEKLKALAHVSPHLHEAYGATGAGWICVAGPEDIRRRPDSVGRAAFLVEWGVVDEAGQPVPDGTVGRLRCRAPGMATQMVGGDALGRPAEDRWLYPGELARSDSDGTLTLCGRSSDLIIRGGANVWPDEVERVLLQHCAVAEAAVLGQSCSVLGEQVVACVVVRQPMPSGDIIEHCRGALAPYKVPARIVILLELPRNTAGKVNKRALAEQLEALPESELA